MNELALYIFGGLFCIQSPIRVFRNCSNVHLHTYQWMKLVDQVNHQQCLFYKFASTYQWVRHAVQLIPPMIFLWASLQTDFHFEKILKNWIVLEKFYSVTVFRSNFWSKFFAFWLKLISLVEFRNPWSMIHESLTISEEPSSYLHIIRGLWILVLYFKHHTLVCTLITTHLVNIK